MHRAGCAIGRFQPPHLGHLHYLLAAKARCQLLLVGLVSPGGRQIAGSTAAPHRLFRMSNPLTHEEREGLLSKMLRACGLKRNEFSFVRFDLDLRQQEPLPLAEPWTALVSVCEPWSYEKIRRLEEQGHPVEVLHETPWQEKGYSGASIRESMRRGDESWRAQIPASILADLEALCLPDRLRGMKE